MVEGFNQGTFYLPHNFLWKKVSAHSTLDGQRDQAYFVEGLGDALF